MIPTLMPLDRGIVWAALESERVGGLAESDTRVAVDQLIAAVNPVLYQLCREAGATVDSLREAQLQIASFIALQTVAAVAPARMGAVVGFCVAEQWLAANSAWIGSKSEHAFNQMVSAGFAPKQREWTGTGPVQPLKGAGVLVLAAALDQVIADPLTVFVAGPITEATEEETTSLITISGTLRDELVQLKVRLHSAPEEADTRVHREFSDHESWRDVDEHWIRRSDLVVILHPRAATGLGCVHEIAASSAVPVLVVADAPLTPMILRMMSPERLLTTNGVVERVVHYIGEHADQMLQRRHLVREAARTSWRPGRTRLTRDLAMLSTDSLGLWIPTTITRERLREALHDDYAFGSLTDFERIQLRQAFRLPKLKPLTRPQRLALSQAAANNNWGEDETWHLELAARELLAADGEWHYAAPHDPLFWEDLYGDLGL